MDDDLGKIYLEGGGGQVHESYELCVIERVAREHVKLSPALFDIHLR